MMGELGELASNLEKWLWYGKQFDGPNFAEELGDANWYQAEALNVLSLKFETILAANIDKLRARYPERYTDELAAEENRNRSKERETIITGLIDGEYAAEVLSRPKTFIAPSGLEIREASPPGLQVQGTPQTVGDSLVMRGVSPGRKPEGFTVTEPEPCYSKSQFIPPQS
jgi:hypothetical protein